MEPYHAYLSLAENELARSTENENLQEVIASLPRLDEEGLTALLKTAEKAAYTRPKLSWLTAHFSRQAVELQTQDVWMRSLAYLFEARAANLWSRPLLAKSAGRKAGQGFLQIGKKEWAAVSEWQFFDQPRLKGILKKADQGLSRALKVLESSDLQKSAAYCRLELAVTEVNEFNFNESVENINKCKTFFEENEDKVGLGHTFLVLGDLRRIQHNFDEAGAQYEHAYQLFSKVNHIPGQAHSLRHAGLNILYGTTKMDEALDYLQRSDSLFQQCDLELYHAFCQTWLGITHLQKGELETVEASFKEASKIYYRHHSYQLLADNFTTYGLFCLSRGQPLKASQLFIKAKKYHVQMGVPTEFINDTLNLGKAYRVAGRYQDALLTLEEAREECIGINNSLQMAYADAQMAFIWHHLNDQKRSIEYLDQSIELYKRNQQNATLITMNNLKAKIFTDQNEYEKALATLNESLKFSIQYSLPPQASLARRLIGELLIKMARYEDALPYLKQAEKEFLEMEMSIEAANSKYSLAELAFAQDDLQNAEFYYQEALKISEGLFDEIDWRAKAGLARVAQARHMPEMALDYYTQSIKSLQNIRENFWQSSLAGAYSQEPSFVFANAAATSFLLNDYADLLGFIETSKANSLIEQFKLEQIHSRNKNSIELYHLKEEISWLREKLNNNSTQNALQNAVQNRQIRLELVEKSKKYEEFNSRLERQNFARNPYFFGSRKVSLEEIQKIIPSSLGGSWLALDLFTSENNIYVSTITPQKVGAYSINLTPRITQAIENIKQNQIKGISAEENDLEILGKAFFHPSVLEVLEKDTRLIISPQGMLHGLPYNALLVDQGSKFLVEKCTPTIIHSLRTALILLYLHKGEPVFSRQKGIVVGLSDFNGLYPSLPFVKQEIDALRPLLIEDSQVLTEQNATWQNLLELSKKNNSTGLSGYSFLHIASHFFSDSISGNLSGLSLHGEEVYQSQLRDLAPLPELVTLSGCNSLFSLNHTGDEPVGLPATCLVSGAKNIVGSYQPVKDEITARFMPKFYKQYFHGLSPAYALAATQREFIASSCDTSNWIGYLCVGVG